MADDYSLHPTGLVTLEQIRDAAERIRGFARETPLLPLALPGGASVRVKCENLQQIGAFKFRGAYNMVSRLSDEQRARGVITYSSGNHGQAVARSAQLVGIPSVIVMPTTAPTVKVEGARACGAEVIFEGTTSLERKARAETEAASRGMTMIPPFDHEEIIAGQGTVGLEILEAWPEVERVAVPIGGGGLASGVATALKRSRPSIEVVGVEPAGAAKMLASIRAGQPVTLASCRSIADGLLPVRPGDLTFAHVRAFVDRIVTVEESEIADMVGWLFRQARLVVEPSGAVSLAGLNKIVAEEKAPRRSVAVLSGGNIGLDDLRRLSEEPR
jgi:threonine dehydratase